MNRRLMALALVLLMAIFASGQGKKTAGKKAEGKKAAAASTEETQETLKNMEMDRAQMTLRGDADGLAKTTSDDYVLIDSSGQISDKAQMLEAFKSGQSKLTSNEPKDMLVHVYGNAAVVTGTSEVKGKIRGRPVNGAMRFTRVWVKREGRWQTVSLQQTPIGK